MTKRISLVTRRVIVAVVAAVVALAFTQVATSAPAAADFAWCTGTGKVCVASDSNGNGMRATIGWPIGECGNLSSTWNDKISSIANKFTSSGGIMTFWHDANCNGWQSTTSPGVTENYVGWFDNDEFTSGCLGPTNSSTTGCGRYTH